MPLRVKCQEIDRENDPVTDPREVARFEDEAAARSYIESEIARFDHNGFVPDGPQAGWWGRSDADRFEKFHFWIETDSRGELPEALRNRGYRGLP
jgi:hypothetical protein